MRQNTPYIHLRKAPGATGKTEFKLYYKIELKPFQRIETLIVTFDGASPVRVNPKKMKVAIPEPLPKEIIVTADVKRGYPEKFPTDSVIKFIRKFEQDPIDQKYTVKFVVNSPGGAGSNGSTKHMGDADG